MKRNLLFHLFPRQRSIWTWHAEQLMARKHVWNGRRVVICVLDSSTDREVTLRNVLAPLEAEIVIKRNDYTLGETRYFLDSLGLLESQESEEVTFYAHGKGTSHYANTVEPVRRWSEAMYTLNLSFINVVERRLNTHATVGAFRNERDHYGSGWHYSGTFFWFKHADLFSRDWRSINSSRWGVEAYPGRHFAMAESSCLTQDNIDPGWLYGLKDGVGVTQEHLAFWCARLEEER